MSTLIADQFIVDIAYTIQGITKTLKLTQAIDNEALSLDWTVENQVGSTSLFLRVDPKVPLTLDRLDLIYDVAYKPTDRIFMNGYQSWTESHERSIKEKQPHISALAKRFNHRYQFSKYGDTEIVNFNKARGHFHGFTFGYLKDGEMIQLMGSLNERTGFTIFEADCPHHKLIIHKDVAGVLISQTTTMDLFFISAHEEASFDGYFTALGIQKPETPKRMGWTSWYNYYEKINEGILHHTLQANAILTRPMDIIQIDDGYQSAVGDWLSVDPIKFPRGMKVVADEILAQGSIAGLWLAPFVAQKESQLVKDHPEWILKDASGQFELAGYGWGFNYCLDLENQEVKAYLRHCFDVVLNEWGYGLVKLDFLYAAALGHHPTKTRGQRMAEAMDFLRSCVKDKLILGCGVPLGSAFGMVEYCRIGPDISLDWDGPWYYQLIHRERVSTKNAILNTIGRRHLDHRAFLNDPDVFLLRYDNITLSRAQKSVLAQVNRIFGSLLFTSDLILEYDQAQRKQWENTAALSPKLILSVNHPSKDRVEVHYREAETNHLALINLSRKPHTFRNGITVAATSIEILDV